MTKVAMIVASSLVLFACADQASHSSREDDVKAQAQTFQSGTDAEKLAAGSDICAGFGYSGAERDKCAADQSDFYSRVFDGVDLTN